MATTISRYSVGLTMDASSYIQNSALSRRETRLLTQQINSARTPAENYERSIDLLNRALKQGTIDLSTYDRLVKKAGQSTVETSKKTNVLATSVKSLAVAYIAYRGAAFAKHGVSLAAEAEQSAVAFRVLTGDAELAAKTLGDLKQFAAETPFQFPEIRKAGQLMLAFGFSADEVSRQLYILGNIAAGTNTPIGELAELVGKARVQNTIYTEDLNQLTGRGINVLSGLAKQFGVMEDQVKKLASEGKIHFSDLQTAMENLSNTDFAGLMVEQSKTLAGQWSTLNDNIDALTVDITEELTPALKGLIPIMSDLVGLGKDFQIGDRLGLGFEAIHAFAKDVFSGEVFRHGERAGTPNLDKVRQDRFGIGMSPVDTNYVPKWYTPPEKVEPLDASAFQIDVDAIGNSLAGSLDGLGAMLSTTFATVGTSIMQAEFAGTEKLIAAQQADPAIAALEVGTQEAYSFLTQGMDRLADEQSKKDAKAEALQAEANAIGEQTNNLLSEMITAFQDTSPRRIR